ncbi:MAG: hypothetical protein IJS28_06055 [Synergistaceae bacterium]|nr:hypothetical protein [Synergistaceae bacterium]
MKHRKIIILLLAVLLGVSSGYAQQFRAALLRSTRTSRRKDTMRLRPAQSEASLTP